MPVQRAGDIVLRDYQIEAFVGEGGFGEVYRARQIHLNQLFALKILPRAEMSAAGYAAAEIRFRKEAQLGVRVNHPAIVRVFGFSWDEGRDQLVLVMAYAAGGSLRQALDERRERQQPYSVTDALRIARGIAGGLAALHAENVIHRDLSPNNILFDGAGAPLIADLGLAQTAEAPSLGRGDSDQPPPHPGTPGYRSPEHADGYNLLKPPADVYALGLLLFEMLTLKQYGGCRPGTRLSTLRPDVPAALDELVAGMLSEDPRQRPWDGAAAGQALGELAATDPVPPPVKSAPAAPAPIPPPLKPSPAAPAPVWTLDDGLYALAGMETAQEWPRAEALLKQLEAAYPGNPRLILARKRIEQALAARRAAEERAAREAAERARQAETARQKAETARQKAETETRLKQAAADHARPQAGETSPPADRSQRTSGQLVSRRTLLIGAIAVGLLVFLMVCGLGAAWMLDALPGNQPTAVSNITPPPPCTNIGQTWTSPVDGMNLVCVPAGDFLMGAADGDADADDDEKPQHTVYLDAYWIDQTEVTNAMFSEFVAATRYRTTAEMEGSGWAYMGSGWDWVDGANWKHPSGPDSKLTDKDHHPVVQISWADAVAYCEWVGRRLPSEAQWEKAARGSGGQTYPWGDQLPRSKTLNFNFGDGDTTAVGSYPDGVSPSGALDMAGNVWEWTADWYDRGYYSSQTTWRNPVGPTRGQYRVVRGGSWCSNSLGDVSSSGRDWNAADDRSDHLGFRCLIDAAP